MFTRTLAASFAVLLGSASCAVFAQAPGAGAAAIHVGFVAAGDREAAQTTLEPFRAYMQGRVGVAVELVPAPSFDALIADTIEDRVQYAILSATAFLIAEQACACVEPLALPAAYDGSIGYHAVIIARADSGIDSISDARGKRLAVADGDSIAGRLLPLAALRDEGIDPGNFFSAVSEMEGPEAAVTAVLTGQADIATAWSSLSGDPAAGYTFGVLNGMAREGKLSPGDITVIWSSSQIPFGPHTVRSDMAQDMKMRLLGALSDMPFAAPDAYEAVDRSGLGGGGFVAVSAGAYDPLRPLMKAE